MTKTDPWRMLSLFAGIGGFDLAGREVGLETVAYSEIADYPRQVMRHWFPSAQDLGDITTVTDLDLLALAPIHVLTGGFPCQDLSVAGKRLGLDGNRSGLFWELIRVRDVLRPWFTLIENVPGLFSSHNGRDFAILLNTLTGRSDAAALTPTQLRLRSPRGKPRKRATSGYVVGPAGMSCWRTLNSEHWVPQRRRRVFILHASPEALERFGADRIREVLLESESVPRDFASGRAPREDVARPLGSRTGGTRQDLDNDTYIVEAPAAFSENQRAEVVMHDIAHNISGMGGKPGQGYAAVLPTPAYNIFPSAGQGAELRAQETEVASLSGRSMETERGTRILQPIAFTCKDHGQDATEGVSPTLRSMNNIDGNINGGGQVAITTPIPRRMTPLECARVQGFPDEWLQPTSDTQKYRAIGNAVTMLVVRWILGRLHALR